ncbi:MAG: endonuclease/exonuclease/phosphatase family protein [Lachnospiraceae bacterium]|nr:endonuclease/exonuclease/phosphatase family protein [Lachnospiraceae bacterium]
MIKKILKMTGIVIAAVLLTAISYVAYVFISYSRIPDMQPLDTYGKPSEDAVTTGTEYTIVTQNCGFGAYDQDFTFFMDGGKQSWADDKETVIKDTDLASEEILSHDPDFILLQEVDTDSTRSYHVNQVERFASSFEGFCSVFSMNYHSAFLMYPPLQPHGKSNSGILTLSKTGITSSMRRSLPISEGFSKILDLDRCYSVSRIPVDNGKEFILYNIHASAYGGSDTVRTGQMTMLLNDMKSEYDKGNYCLCGGDFNHDFPGNSRSWFGSGVMDSVGWAHPFPVDLIPEGISQCLDYDDDRHIATCRNCDVPYGPDCQTVVVDGFLISDNISCTELHNIDAAFIYSDHNPVEMKFELKD